jgi:hypothetical protein
MKLGWALFVSAPRRDTIRRRGGDHVGSPPWNMFTAMSACSAIATISADPQQNTHGISLRQRDDAPDLVRD